MSKSHPYGCAGEPLNIPKRSRGNFVLILALAVLVSGCVHEDELNIPNTGEFDTSPSLGNSELKLENMTSFKENEVGEVARNFYKRMPENKTERLELTSEVADEACNLDKLDKSMFRSAAQTKRQAYRVKHAAEMLEENFNQEISPKKIERVIEGAGRVGKFVTIVGPYNQFVEDSCQFDIDKPETREDFYLSSASLGLELALIQYSVYYKGASEVTRMASHSRTFRMVQSKFGDETLGTLMSETHWATRNTFQGSKQFVAETAQDYNLSGEIKINESQLRGEAEEKYGWAANKTQEAVESANFGDRLGCLENSTNWKLAGDVARVLSDGEVREEEIQSLPSPVQEDFANCLG